MKRARHDRRAFERAASRLLADPTTVSGRRARAGEAHDDAAARAVTAVVEAAPGLRTLDSYDALLGAPTWRERLVAALTRMRSRALEYAATPRLGLVVASIGIMVLIAVVLMQPFATPNAIRTEVAQVRVVDLEDGSKVTLGARSRVDLQLSDAERRVVLDAGEAFFDVAHRADQPFVVVAGETRVIVTGTRFNVKRIGQRVRVTVLEGSVRVVSARADQMVRETRLEAGQQVLAEPAAALEPELVLASEPGSWREGRLSYQDAPLSEIVADINRYRTKPVRIAGDTLAEARLTTSFRVAQVEDMLATLPEILPLALKRAPNGSVDLVPREAPADAPPR